MKKYTVSKGPGHMNYEKIYMYLSQNKILAL